MENNDYERARIKESIARFTKKYDALASDVSRTNYDGPLSAAEMKLSSYAAEEKAAAEAARDVTDILSTHGKFLSARKAALPVIGARGADYTPFEPAAYAGGGDKKADADGGIAPG